MAKEYIERDAAKKEFSLRFGGVSHAVIANRILDEIPAADVVEVVRCAERSHWHKDVGWCDKHSHFILSDGEFCHPWESSSWKMFDADYWCADGERRDNDAAD